MANRVKMAVEESIIECHRKGWSNRRIARALDIDRETVARYVRLAAKPAILPAGADGPKPAISPPGDGSSNPAISPVGNFLRQDSGQAGRFSQCRPFKETIEEALEGGLTAQRIYQDLVGDHGFDGSYDSVKRFTRRLRVRHPERFHRMESIAGDEAQVDFGRGAPIRTADGRRQKTWVFRIVLSYSRKAYSEVVLRQTTEVFVRCLENAFRYFGGVPKTLVIDNLRAAVSKVDWYEPEINPKVLEFCRYYGTVILPTRPYTPEHKGKVESSVKYVKNNALKGREFASLAEENTYLLEWEKTVADQRIHGTTRQQVMKLFAKELPALQALPAMIFPCFQEGRRRVHRDSFVEVHKAYYEVPEEYIGRDLWVRSDGRVIKIFNDRFEQVAMHAQVEKGRFCHSENTTSRGRMCGVEKTAAYLVKRAIKMGNHCGAWADVVLSHRGVEAIRSLYGFLSLARHHSSMTLDKVCASALTHGLYRLGDIRRLLDNPIQQESLSFLESHPLIRDINEYGQFLESLYPQNETPKQKEAANE